MTKRPLERDKRRTPPSAIAELATGQHGVVSVAQLVSLGLDRRAVTRLVASGRLHRLYRGVYAVGHAALSRAGRWLAATMASGEGAALGRRSAGLHWGISRHHPPLIEIVVPRQRRAQKGIKLLTSRGLQPRDVTVLDRIPTTTVARTHVDLTDVLTSHQLARVIRETEFHGRFDAAETAAAMRRANGRHRIGVLEQAIAMYLDGAGGTKSANEDAFLPLARRAGLPEPRSNARVAGIEVDFSWPGLPLVVEIDGGSHRLQPVRRDDDWRDDWLRGAGYTVLRFTDFELEHRPDAIVAALAGWRIESRETLTKL
jgi:very-short-patch-repair endonuclease/predicted transcriptional regulator of viral defense system